MSTRNIEQLNADCTCVTLDHAALCAALTEVVGDPAFCADLARTHPHLVASQPVFLTASHAEAMQEAISAIERVARLPAYPDAIADHVPDIARAVPGAVGVFMGYDFHLSPERPRLIEINTNAGGALINAYLLGAQYICCGGTAVRAISVDAIMQTFLRLESGHLWCGADRVDLVYNRVTDFDLSDPRHAVLRGAYASNAAVLTPNPWGYAHLADKRNLIVLSDATRLKEMGAATDDIETLRQAIPRTIAVTRDNADALWKRRNSLFFKPVTGFGSKAAYLGDKLTTRAWTGILERPFVAQDIVAPSARAVALDGQIANLKADLRCYTYAGRIQFIAARLYSGQTTNFRTEGGGFAPVFVSSANADCHC